MKKMLEKKRIPLIGFQILLLLFLASLAFPLYAEEMFNGSVTADGEVLVFSGRVLDRSGRPVPATSVEIWQTDEHGIYDHPGDSSKNRRDKNFQFYGTSFTDLSGKYGFRTIIPGKYEPRPRHIHVKIRQSGRVLLTSQIYFTIDGETSGVGGSARNLRMDLNQVQKEDGNVFYTGVFDFIVDIGIDGNLRLTDSQAEGPYYPRDDVSSYDNDLARVAAE